MKNYILLFSLVLLTFSCNNADHKCEVVSNGFTSTEGEKVTMGSQESVDFVMSIDKAWKMRDYDTLKSLISDDAELLLEDGRVLTGGDAFVKMVQDDYQESVVENGGEWNWTVNYAFSVKPDSNKWGEYVNARFTGSSGIFEEWYQIKDGKLVSWTQSKRASAVK
tara:strand:- start:1083 stop:1577 length:495 start_codon:yes stop_codon:yes gene_type:complete